MNTDDAHALYAHRMFVRLDKDLQRLKKIENGEIPVIVLGEQERKILLDFERALGDELENIFEIKMETVSLYAEYFLTEIGKKDFHDSVGIDIEGKTIEEVRRNICKKRQAFARLPGKRLSALAVRSRIYADNRIYEALKSRRDDEDGLHIAGMADPARIFIVTTPDNALRKIRMLRDLKRKVCLKDSHGKNGSMSEALLDAQKKIQQLYRKKINEMIAAEAYVARWINELSYHVTYDDLIPAERELLVTSRGLSLFEKVYVKFDRVIHGSHVTADEKTIAREVEWEIETYIELIEKRYLDGQFEMEQCLVEKGLDPEKVERADVDVATFSVWVEGLLEAYGEKSVFSPKSYDPSRIGAAPDGKWQFIANDQYVSMAVNALQKIIKSGRENKTIVAALATLLGHEGVHFVQALNQSRLPLRLFVETGGDHAKVFSEGGAMMVEDIVMKECFGYAKNPGPRYLKAMLCRLRGGTYLECVKTFYDGGLVNIRKKYQQGILSESLFQNQKDVLLKNAICGVKRLYTSGEHFSDRGGYVPKSKDVIYAEQRVVMEKLKVWNMEKYAFVRGLNLDTMVTLAELGLLKINDIVMPDIEYIRNIWAREKEKYALQPQAVDFSVGVKQVPVYALSRE